MKLIWDRLHHGFILNETHVTYNPDQARQYSEPQADLFTVNDDPRRFMVLDVKQDTPEHPCYQALTVRHCQMVEITEEDCAGTRILPKDSDSYALLSEIGMITSEVDLGQKWYFEYRGDRSGLIKFGMADTEQATWDKALVFARKQMGGTGDRPAYSMFAYVRALKLHGLSTDLSMPLELALNNAPACQQNPVTKQVGEVHTFSNDSEKQAYRRNLLRSLIAKTRFRPARFFRGYRCTLTRTSGRLTPAQKSQILEALAIFDNADRIEVAGVKTASAYVLSPSGPSVLSSSHHCYQLLFLATLNNQRRMLLGEL